MDMFAIFSYILQYMGGADWRALKGGGVTGEALRLITADWNWMETCQIYSLVSKWFNNDYWDGKVVSMFILKTDFIHLYIEVYVSEVRQQYSLGFFLYHNRQKWGHKVSTYKVFAYLAGKRYDTQWIQSWIKSQSAKSRHQVSTKH